MSQQTYNVKPVLSRDERRSSKTFALKTFHRFLKNHLFYDVVQVKSKRSILDVCCGRGNDINTYKRAHNIFMEDVSLNQIAILKDRLPEPYARQTIRIHSGSCFDEDPPWADLSFDLIVCNFGIHYGSRDDILNLFYHARKVLRTNGRFLIIYPDAKKMIAASEKIDPSIWSAKKISSDKIVFNMGTDIVDSHETYLTKEMMENFAEESLLKVSYHEPFVATFKRPANLLREYYALSSSYSALVLSGTSST